MNTTNNLGFRVQSLCRTANRRHSVTLRNHFDAVGWLQGNLQRVVKKLTDSDRVWTMGECKTFINDV
ncbi:MAG: hypothetical protein HHJ17_11255 [Rhodoferax sp.]|uniref:hypothetical protein n=1 Tax=Rhodoferax sp. TaxID=50421 RepID=UPI00185E6228|nr:hypothetical protein [Rhodoferax sp.]NMM14098.1 hypothetical protein [Rhodoferax sp.]